MRFTLPKFFKSKAAEQLEPSDSGGTLARALELRKHGRLKEAAGICRAIVDREPDHVDALLLSAEIAGADGQSDAAHAFFARVMRLRPDHSIAFYKRGNLLRGLGEWGASLRDYDRAIGIDSSHAAAFCNRGVVLAHLERWEDALSSYERAIELNPQDSLAHFNRGAVLRQMKRYDEALLSYDFALAVSPKYAECHFNRGLLLAELKRWDAALASLSTVIEMTPEFAGGYFNRGSILLGLSRYEHALRDFEKTIDLNPQHAEAFNNRGNIFFYTGRFAAAVASYDKAIEFRPAYAEAFTGRGLSLHNLRRFEESVISYDRALALQPDQRYVLGMRLQSKMQICDWNGISVDLHLLSEGLQAGNAVSTPHTVLALLDSVPLHRRAAEIWVREECMPDSSLGSISARPTGPRIKIGYFSADFRDHPVSLLAAGLFEAHDRSRFETIAFAFGPQTNDEVRSRLERAFDRFIDVSNVPDAEVAKLARNAEVDIAVDLGGFTGHARTRVFALRAAPIQVNYLGYPGTMGAPYMDYLIGDATVVPEVNRPHYAEKIIYLPHCYLPNDPTRKIADTIYTRQALGLPDTGFIFCCFNNSYKITPTVFEVWMRVLRRVDGVLWISWNNDAAVSNLRKEATRLGVDPARIIFADRLFSLPEHLARHRVGGLFLDTLPYNAHATSIDAIWTGVPVLTRRGEGFAGRVAASLLESVGIPELITTSAEQYEEMAVHLATNPGHLAEIRARLERTRDLLPVFDTPLLARHLEFAYRAIHERHQAGLPPDHFWVTPEASLA